MDEMSAAHLYAQSLARALERIGIVQAHEIEDVQSEIQVYDAHGSVERGYGNGPVVLCEMGDLELLGDHVVFYHRLGAARSEPVHIPKGFVAEPYTCYAVNIYPKAP